VTLAAGFSGHGFKFTPKIGEYLAELTTSESATPVPEFALARFAAVTGAA
jgi:sarcosine oxidase